tara:strand:- start:81 stop:2288 length:2208 start_codon:yes stop_codon:yes gene_type:complete
MTASLKNKFAKQSSTRQLALPASAKMNASNKRTMLVYDEKQMIEMNKVKTWAKVKPNLPCPTNGQDMGGEIYVYGHLFQLMIPEFIVPKAIDWGATMFSFEPEIGKNHVLIALDENGLALLHDSVTSSFGCMGSMIKNKGDMKMSPSDMGIIKYHEPASTILEISDEGENRALAEDLFEHRNMSYNITTLGESSRMRTNHVYLLNPKFDIIAILIDPRRDEDIITEINKPLMRVMNEGRLGWIGDKEDKTIHEGLSPSLMGYEGDYHTLNMVSTFLDQRFLNCVLPNLKFDISVYNSLISKLNNTTLSMRKKMLLHSPFLNEGVTFTITVERTKTYHKWRRISLWKENYNVIDKEFIPTQRINVYVQEWEQNIGKGITLELYGIKNEKDGLMTDMYWYFFDYDELPDKLNDKTLSSFFKKKKFNNKKRLKEAEKYVEERFGFGAVLDESLLRYTTQLSFFKSVVLARNFTKLNAKHGFYEERKDQQEILTLFIKLICAYCDPKLRGQMRRVKNENGFNRPSFSKIKKGKFIPNKWEWGTDRINYITPSKTQGNKLNVRTYVHPDFGTYYISKKNINKYKDNFPQELEEPIKIRENDIRHYSVNIMKVGFWKGDGEKLRFPKYYAGKFKKRNSAQALAWLKGIAERENIFIQHADNLGEQRIQSTPYRVDGFCEDTNTVYEYHGCYWHGCKKCFPDRNKMHPVIDKTMKQLYVNTLKRDKIIKSLGYNLIIKWECD